MKSPCDYAALTSSAAYIAEGVHAPILVAGPREPMLLVIDPTVILPRGICKNWGENSLTQYLVQPLMQRTSKVLLGQLPQLSELHRAPAPQLDAG